MSDVKTFVVTGDTLERTAANGSTIAKDARHIYGEDNKGVATIDGVTVVKQLLSQRS